MEVNRGGRTLLRALQINGRVLTFAHSSETRDCVRKGEEDVAGPSTWNKTQPGFRGALLH